MLTFAQALEQIAAAAGHQPTETIATADADGLVLAEVIRADADSPPFDKALMDGFAVRDEDMGKGKAELTVIGTLMAGSVADQPMRPGECYEIMTGAPLPAGADAVVMVERSCRDGSLVLLDDSKYRAGQNVMRQGEEMRRDQVILEPGSPLGPAEIGLLATVGRTSVHVARRPTIAILTTGDELVPPESVPGPGQIRNSNASVLVSMARSIGAIPRPLGIARDQPEDLARKVAEGLSADVLVLSGGVSAGKRDLVPSILAAAGVETVFHGVEFKPGRPLWFGRHAGGLVFGLPGNPVSTLVCFELFVKTALRCRTGHRHPWPRELPAKLAVDFRYPVHRLTYHPARTEFADGELRIQPLEWRGSPDMKSLCGADAFVILPPGEQPRLANSTVRFLPFHWR